MHSTIERQLVPLGHQLGPMFVRSHGANGTLALKERHRLGRNPAESNVLVPD